MRSQRAGASLLVLALLLAACGAQAEPTAGQRGSAAGRLQGGRSEAVQAPTIHLRQPGITTLPHAPAPKPADEHLLADSQQQQQLKLQAQARQPAASGTALLQQHRRDGAGRPRVPLGAVVLMSAFMSLMSCLGVAPYFVVRQLSKPWAGLANAVASGVMLAASFGLLAEGAPYGGTYLIAGMLLGVVFVKLSQEHLEQYEVDSFEQLAGADARKVILFLAVMAVHAVGEGGGVGVSFAGDRGWAQGTLVTLAIGLHNVPEGLAVATVMAAKGTPPRRVLLWTALTALPQALVAPPAFLFVDTFRALLPLAMGFAAGCMVWIVLAELLPDALEAVEAERVATYATGSAAWLQGLSMFIAHLETPAGTLASPFGDYASVMPFGLGRLLLQLAPIAAAPALLAWCVSGARLARPAAVGGAAGLLGGYALACWLQLLLGSHNRLMCGLAWPLAGAVAAAGLWSHLTNGWQAADAAPLDISTDACCGGTKAAGSQQQQQQQQRAAEHPGPPPLVLPGQQQQQQQQQWLGSPRSHAMLARPASSLVVTAPAAQHLQGSSAHARHARPPWECEQQQQQAGSVASWDASSCSSNSCGSAHGSPMVRCGSPLPLPGSGDLLLPMAAVPDKARRGGKGGLYGGAVSSRAVAGACLLALGGVAGAGVPLGLQLAGALAAAPDHVTHVLLPMVLLQGGLFGAACLGLLLPLLGQQARPLLAAAAGGVGSVPLLVALAVLLMQPGWVQQGLAYGAADSLQGLAVGFNAFVLLLLVLPMARRWAAQQAHASFAAGAAASLLACAGLGLLCLSTPYCLHASPASLLSGVA